MPMERGNQLATSIRSKKQKQQHTHMLQARKWSSAFQPIRLAGIMNLRFSKLERMNEDPTITTTITQPASLMTKIKLAAGASGQSISAWIADAAAAKLGEQPAIRTKRGRPAKKRADFPQND
jgi:hypothetical protein